MRDNRRAALYDAALPANAAEAARTETAHIAGHYGESGDVSIRNATFPTMKIGDLVTLGGAGAYTLSLASNYDRVR